MDQLFKKPCFSLFLVGYPGSEKTTAIRNICKGSIVKNKCDYIMAFTPTYFSEDGSYDFIPKGQISGDYTEDKIKKIMQTQKSRIQQGKKSRLLLILDDCLGSVNFKSDTLKELISNRRHYKISIVIGVQYIKALPPMMRIQTDYLMLYKLSSKESMRMIGYMWLHDRPDYEDFINKNTSPKYYALFVDTYAEPENKYQKVKFAPVKPFRITMKK